MKGHITDLDARVVLAFADNNMNATETGRKLFLSRNTVRYHLESVGKKTGLSPLKFYDLVKLVGILKETEGRQWIKSAVPHVATGDMTDGQKKSTAWELAFVRQTVGQPFATRATAHSILMRRTDNG